MPKTLKSKFQDGDLVRVSKDAKKHMGTGYGDCDAIILEVSENSESFTYALHLKGKGFCAWYDEAGLTMIESNRPDMLRGWKAEQETEKKLHSDLDWIFSHGPELIKKAPGTSVQALANCFGVTNLWGSRGEGIEYYTNAHKTMALAEPYLKENDKEGFLKFAKEVKEKIKGN